MANTFHVYVRVYVSEKENSRIFFNIETLEILFPFRIGSFLYFFLSRTHSSSFSLDNKAFSPHAAAAACYSLFACASLLPRFLSIN